MLFRSLCLTSLFIILLNKETLSQECQSHFPWILSDICGYAPVVLWQFPKCNDLDEIILEDNFDNDSLDRTKWGESWLRSSLGGTTLEYSSFENISISNGICHIIAKRDTIVRKAIPDRDSSEILSDGIQNLRTFYYSSGMLVSIDYFVYGKFEAVFRIPQGAGLWPAFWTFGGIRWNELDFFDGFKGVNDYHLGAIYDYNGNGCYAHEGESCGADVLNIEPDLTNWHKITCVNDWYQTTWMLDDKVVHTESRFSTISGKYLSCGDDIEKGVQYNYRKNLPLEPMHLIINLQIGAENSAVGPVDEHTIFPASFDIDYVKVWKREFKDIGLILTPNPNNGHFTAHLFPTTESTKKLSLFNSFGQKVFESEDMIGNDFEFNTSFLFSGVYVCKISFDETIVTGKMIIQN